MKTKIHSDSDGRLVGALLPYRANKTNLETWVPIRPSKGMLGYSTGVVLYETH